MRNCTYNKIVHCLFYVVLYVIQIYSINNIEIIKYTTLYNIINTIKKYIFLLCSITNNNIYKLLHILSKISAISYDNNSMYNKNNNENKKHNRKHI
ncbi:hypothetical protein PFNF135_02835 [Plasmodium falciparum NF135/5.C10]|uniref:Uncharacterized protein n=1 Tax=Plasmodium falciparum NF135/5.C10 TaxID=1036726 RepID=W4IIA6_PLAFA|nr:hypothetical protein PFNF135_02835 [Plasmodium falciparum NF135/5.C10]